jgi:hypothetical protein
MIKLTTNFGAITIELDAEKAPKSAANFLAYVEAGHYDNTIFHRVIDGFMIQGGGFTAGMDQKPVKAPIENEAKNGLKNDRYTVAMARTGGPALGHRPVLHQRRRQRLPRQRQVPGRLGLLRLRPRHRGPGRGGQDQGRQDRQQGLPPERAEG